ncbi:hypothetical protein quinque_001968 [Culex quinquefasciatus]
MDCPPSSPTYSGRAERDVRPASPTSGGHAERDVRPASPTFGGHAERDVRPVSPTLRWSVRNELSAQRVRLPVVMRNEMSAQRVRPPVVMRNEMSAQRTMALPDDDVDVSSAESSGQNAPVGKEGNNPQAIGVPNQRENEMSGQSQERDTTDPEHNRSITTTVEPQGGEGAASEMLQRMENVLAAITDKISYLENMQMVHTPMATTPDSDQTWSTPNIATVPSRGHVMSVRCDNVKPFPSGVPANKLWETWNGYIEIFEMSANLAGVNDPVKRSQLLYLSVGEELQGVITAAKLRPSLNDPDCYQRFVANIHNYFRSMMDPAAEHENFSKLRQGKTESALAFHARLTSKVRLCGYNPGDHEMFVRSQLLKGLRNKKLAKNARIYGQATNDVVLSAGRSDCLESEIADPDPPSIDRPEVYAVQQQKPFEPRFNGKKEVAERAC